MGIIIGLLVLVIVGYVFYSKKMCCNKSTEAPMVDKPSEMPMAATLMSAPEAMPAKKAPAKAAVKKVTKVPAAKKVATKGKAASATKGKK